MSVSQTTSGSRSQLIRLMLTSVLVGAVALLAVTGPQASATGGSAGSAGSTRLPVTAYDSADVVFESYPWEIWTMDRWGGHRRQLTFDNGSYTNEGPVWSSDGSKIAWVRLRQDAPDAIWVMNWDGSGKRKVFQASIYDYGIHGLSWSANDRRIAFGMSGQIQILNLETMRRGNPAPSMFGGGPGWSPDGRWIAFWGTPESPSDDRGLWVMRPDGSDLHQIYNRQRGNGVAWSPNGRHIAYSTYRPRIGFQIWVMRSDGTGIRHVTEGLDPTWLADGKTLVFYAYPGLPDFYPFDYLFRSDLHGENVRPYRHGPDVLWDTDADGRPRILARE